MAINVGLTGGIGSGKSTVARIFEVLRVPVYYADDRARKLMNEDQVLKELITRHFGTAAYDTGGLNRKFLASEVFGNTVKLDLLNSLVHPAAIADGQKWSQLQTFPYSIKEAALLFEAGSAKSLDFIIGVSAPRALRIRRVMERDLISREDVIKRMDRQMDEVEKMKQCDVIILNDEEHPIIPQVISVHEKLLALSGEFKKG